MKSNKQRLLAGLLLILIGGFAMWLTNRTSESQPNQPQQPKSAPQSEPSKLFKPTKFEELEYSFTVQTPNPSLAYKEFQTKISQIDSIIKVKPDAPQTEIEFWVGKPKLMQIQNLLKRLGTITVETHSRHSNTEQTHVKVKIKFISP